MPGFQVSGDIALSADGRYLLLWQGLEEIAHRVRVALQIWRGTWIYDQTVGIRYLPGILGKPAALGLLRSEVYRTLLSVSGITAVSSVDVQFVRANRAASVAFKAQTAAGELKDRVTLL